LSIAEETVTEFISKATGTAIDWIQLPGMKVCHDPQLSCQQHHPKLILVGVVVVCSLVFLESGQLARLYIGVLK
jgi:hypothetical protein